MKKYLYASLLCCIATFTNAQTIKNVTILNASLSKPVVDGVIDAAYGDLSNSIANCIDLSDNTCKPGLVQQTNCNNVTTWSAVYTDDSLYFIIKVVDNSVQPVGDEVEIMLSMTNNRVSSCPANWPQYTASDPSNTSQTIINSVTGAYLNKQGFDAAIHKPVIVNTTDGYIIETAFSFYEMDYYSELPVTEGRVIGLDISNNDADQSGGRQSQLMWNSCCGDRAWTDSKDFGTITLGGPVGVNSLSALVNSISLFPNPAANQVNVMVNATKSEQVSVSMINSLSQKVYSSTQMINAGNNSLPINTSNLGNGVYTVVISKGNQNATEMVIINK